MQTLISNLIYSKSLLLAFGIVWIVFLIYIFRLLQTRKKLCRQMDLLKKQ
ncbi:MAG: CcmD family protein [Methanosarcinales archaeon]|nr:CcmD family protein [Methanosarcinales archaeon]